MSAIDEFLNEMVYAADGAARQSFSLDRDNAIALLREFALADPHFYILELVQAAVANGAKSVEIVLYRYGAQVDLRVHWQGDCFSRLELTNLLDYLFEDQEDVDQADRILFSRGINGLLRFEPATLRIFSAGYGQEGPTEVELDGRTGAAVLREPDEERLRRGGVTIHADDLRAMPEHLRFARARNVLWPEDLALKQRLVAETEVLFNEAPVMPAFRAEMPAEGVQVVEEPDIRGVLWRSEKPRFHLVTFGVAIETVSQESGPFANLSGFVESHRFVKTADQYRIVREAHFDHVVARLLPYVRTRRATRVQRQGDDRGPSHGFRWLDEGPVRPEELAKVMSDASLLVAIGEEDREAPELGWERFACESGGEVLVVPPGELENLRALAAQHLEVVRLSWRSDRDRAFAQQRMMESPARPWLIEEITSPPMPLAEVLENLSEQYDLKAGAREEFRDSLGMYGDLVARVFTPDREDGGEIHRDWVRLRSCGRLAWSGAVGPRHPGHVLQVDLPAVSPEFLMSEASEKGERWVRILAEFAVNLARAELERATEMAIARVEQAGTEPGSVASRIALRRLSSDVILRLRVRGESRAPLFSPVAMKAPERLLRVPLVRSLAGEAYSLEEICANLLEWGGVVPFVHDDTPVDVQGEDLAALVLDEEQEELLGEILGLAFLEPLDEPEVAAERRAEREVVQSMEGEMTVESVEAAARAGRQVVMLDGRPGVGSPEVAEAAGPFRRTGPLELMMNTWLAARMHSEGAPVQSGFEFPFPTESPEAYLAQRDVELPFARGTVGLLRGAEGAGKVAVLSGDQGTSVGLALEAGSRLAGALEVGRRSGTWREDLVGALREVEEELWEELLGQLRSDADAQEALLEFAGRHLNLFVDKAGIRHFDVSHPVAEAIFAEPLALCGPFPLTLERLTRDYCLGDGRRDKPWLEFKIELPAPVAAWTERYLRPEREKKVGRRTTVSADLTGISQLFQAVWPDGDESLAIQLPFEAIHFAGELGDFAMVALKDSEDTTFGFLILDEKTRVELEPAHPLVARALVERGLELATVALLYGIYDGLRRFFSLPLGHELAFQEALVIEMMA